MQDQVNNLNARGVKAVFLGQGAAPLSAFEILEARIFLIYLAPERLLSFLPEITKIYQAKQLGMFAVDEAHLIPVSHKFDTQEWGRTFRPEFGHLSIFRKHCPDVPVVAVTATATGETVQIIATSLALRSPIVLYTTLYRDNLSLNLRHRKDWSDLLVLREYQSGIVYTNTRRSCQDIALFLQNSGLVCEAYHGGLPIQQRVGTLLDSAERHPGPVCRADVEFCGGNCSVRHGHQPA